MSYLTCSTLNAQYLQGPNISLQIYIKFEEIGNKHAKKKSPRIFHEAYFEFFGTENATLATLVSAGSCCTVTVQNIECSVVERSKASGIYTQLTCDASVSGSSLAPDLVDH